MQLYLNHVLTQANLNKLAKETQFSFSQSAYDQAQTQSIDLPSQLSFLLEPGFCVQVLTPPRPIKEQASKLLRAVPDRTTMALFLNAIHQSLVVPTTPISPDPENPLNDQSVRYCFTLSPTVRDWLITRRDTHGNMNKPSMAINYLFRRTLPPNSPNSEPIQIPIDNPPTHLTITLPYETYRKLVSIAIGYRIQSSNARNDTGLAAAAIEALVRGLI